MTNADGRVCPVATLLERTYGGGCPEEEDLVVSESKLLSLHWSISATVGHIFIRCSDCEADYRVEISPRLASRGTSHTDTPA